MSDDGTEAPLGAQAPLTSEFRGGAWTAQRPFVSLINDAAANVGVSVRWLSHDWIARLQRESEIRYIHGTAFPINNAGAAHIASDKVATYIVLNDVEIPAVPHHLVRFSSIGETDVGVERVLSEISPPYVVKPSDEAGGLHVHKAQTADEARALINSLATRYAALAVCPFETILHEYRVVLIGNDPKLVYRKELADQEWRHNLKHGARPVLEENEHTCAALVALAQAALQAIDGKFMAVDIIQTPTTLKVLEINSGVTLDRFAAQNRTNRSAAVAIYAEAITHCF